MWAIFHRSPNPAVAELMNQVSWLDPGACVQGCMCELMALASRCLSSRLLWIQPNAVAVHLLLHLVPVLEAAQCLLSVSQSTCYCPMELSSPAAAFAVRQGCRLMTHAPQLVAAKELFTAITKMEPSFAEAGPSSL